MKTHTLPRRHWVIGFRQRGAVFDPAGPYVVGSEGGNVTVDTSHADYPKRPEPPSVADMLANAPISLPVQQARRDACAGCEWHGDMTLMSGHCRKIRTVQCASSTVVFATSPASKCPLKLWPA